MTAAPFPGVCYVQGPSFRPISDLLCLRWYLAYNLSLRDLEVMMAERGVKVDHSTVHRWVVHFSTRLLENFIDAVPATDHSPS